MCVASFEITIATIVNARRTHMNDERLGCSVRPSDNVQRHIRKTECVLGIPDDQPEAASWNRIEFEATLFVSESSSNQAMIFFREQSQTSGKRSNFFRGIANLRDNAARQATDV
jgi:hypothetical protein